MNIRVRNARLSFENIRKPYTPKTGAPKWSSSFICDENTTVIYEDKDGKRHEIPHTKFNEVILPLLLEERDIKMPKVGFFPFLYARADQQVGTRKPKISEKTGDYYKGYEEDTMFFSAGTKVEDNPDGPLILGPKPSDGPLAASTGKPKSGDYVTALISAYAYSGDNGTGISGGLEGVQYLRKGEGFGGQSAADPSSFDEEEVEEDEVDGDADDCI